MRAQKIRKHPIELKQDYPLVYEKEYSAGFRDVGRCALGLAPGNRASRWVQVLVFLQVTIFLYYILLKMVAPGRACATIFLYYILLKIVARAARDHFLYYINY